jgi:phosphocarrier protein
VVTLIEREVLIINRAGIHARPAAKLVQTASAFSSDIFLESGGERVNGKSIMGIITLGATYQTTVKIIADGTDERAAVAALAELFAHRFEDPEP